MSTEDDSAGVPARRRRQISLACYACRRKHLKCDGSMPVCARCASTATHCTYLPSRRGLSGRPQHPPHALPAGGPTPSQSSNASPPEQHSHVDSTAAVGLRSDTSSEASLTFSAAERNHYVGLYYARFHPSHPMLVPRAHFAAQQYPNFLVMAVCLVGKHFTPFQPSEASTIMAFSMVVSAEGEDSSCRVQAFILLALIFLGCNDMSRVYDCLGRAARLARESRLDSVDSLPSQGFISSLKRESLRRSWWELYATDALVALLQGQQPLLETQSTEVLPSVPCVETQYETGEPSAQRPTYAEFERRVFFPNSTTFSSHFFRIEAVTIIRRVLPLYTREDTSAHELEAVSNAIASWSYYLPESSFPLSESLVECDHVLLQAQLLVQVASIFLHFSRSNLPSSKPSAVDITCVTKGPLVMEHSTLHSAHSIAASKELCNIASNPGLRDSYSPMAVCGLLLGCAVQLSAASKCDKLHSDANQQYRHRVVLMLGALNYIGKAWPCAQGAVDFVRPFADRVFSTPNDDRSRPANTLFSSVAQAMPSSSGPSLREGATGEHNSEAFTDPALFENAFDINWFDFFQSMDATSALPDTGLQ